MKDWTKAVYVSLIIRWDSAAMVPKTREDFPEPDTPVKTVRRRLGMSREMSARLFSRAPRTWMTWWLSAAMCTELLEVRRLGLLSALYSIRCTLYGVAN